MTASLVLGCDSRLRRSVGSSRSIAASRERPRLLPPRAPPSVPNFQEPIRFSVLSKSSSNLKFRSLETRFGRPLATAFRRARPFAQIGAHARATTATSRPRDFEPCFAGAGLRACVTSHGYAHRRRETHPHSPVGTGAAGDDLQPSATPRVSRPDSVSEAGSPVVSSRACRANHRAPSSRRARVAATEAAARIRQTVNAQRRRRGVGPGA